MAKYAWRIKIKRIIFSIGGDIFAMLAIIASLIIRIYTTTNEYNSNLNWILFLLAFTGAFFLGKQWYVKYMEMTYDPTWALKFQDRIFSNDMLKKRGAAAKCIIENKERLSDIDQIGDKLCMIDWVLFYLEDIGFYVEGMKISPEVAYHHFYHWIRGYYLLTYPYIKAYQARPHEKRVWENVEYLYNITSSIAAKKGESLTMKEGDLIKFIEEERDLLQNGQTLKCPLE